jgi:hypothetical protein
MVTSTRIPPNPPGGLNSLGSCAASGEDIAEGRLVEISGFPLIAIDFVTILCGFKVVIDGILRVFFFECSSSFVLPWLLCPSLVYPFTAGYIFTASAPPVFSNQF